MARRRDIGDDLVDEALKFYWDNEPDEFECWLEDTFSRRLAKIITGKERTELGELTSEGANDGAQITGQHTV